MAIHKGMFHIVLRTNDGEELYARLVDGYIETFDNNLKVGYDKRKDKWYATEITTGCLIDKAKTKKDIINKTHVIITTRKFKEKYNNLKLSSLDENSIIYKSKKCIAEAIRMST